MNLAIYYAFTKCAQKNEGSFHVQSYGKNTKIKHKCYFFIHLSNNDEKDLKKVSRSRHFAFAAEPTS